MKAMVYGMVIALGCILLLSQAVDAQSVRRISGDHWFGCTSKEEFNKIWEYAANNDEQSFNKAWTDGIRAGTITEFKNGEEVYIADTAIFSGLIKVRRKGETKEYWTNLEAVTK